MATLLDDIPATAVHRQATDWLPTPPGRAGQDAI